MSFDPQFLSMMQTVAQWLDQVALDGYMTPTFGDPVDFSCHVTYKRVIIRSDTGNDRTSTAQLQCPPPGWIVNGVATPTITVDDHIVLPFDGIQRRVLNVVTYTDESTASGDPFHHQSISVE